MLYISVSEKKSHVLTRKTVCVRWKELLSSYSSFQFFYWFLKIERIPLRLQRSKFLCEDSQIPMSRNIFKKPLGVAWYITNWKETATKPFLPLYGCGSVVISLSFCASISSWRNCTSKRTVYCEA
jgi:hypothetical protein